MCLRTLKCILTAQLLLSGAAMATTPVPDNVAAESGKCEVNVTNLVQSSDVLAPGLPASPVIDGHLKAYQERNLERFAGYFADDIRSYKNGQDNLSGIAQLREVYGSLFLASPNLRVRISARRIEGEYVYDTEHVFGLRGSDKEITAQVRYKVVNDKIVEMDLKI